MGLIDLDLSTLEVSDEIRAAISEGQTAYREVSKLRNKNTEIIGEKKAYADKYTAIEQKLLSKGLSVDALDAYDPSAGNEEQVKRFQQQLEAERTTFNSKSSELTARLELANRERENLSGQIEQSKVRQSYLSVAKDVGVNADFADDLFLRLNADGVKFTVDQESGEVRGKRSSDVVDYSPDALLTNLKGDPKYQKYFDGKFGGGSGTNPNGGKSGAPNPFAAETFNLTEQTRLYNADSVRALEMRRLARG